MSIELSEGMFWSIKADRSGGSYVFTLTPEIREYLGCEKDSEGDIYLAIKADKGKHGRFIGIGFDKKRTKSD